MKKEKKKKSKLLLVLILIIAILICIVIFMKQSKKIDIIGKWEYEGGGFAYTFNEDGTGIYEAMGRKIDFTYKTSYKNKLTITYKESNKQLETEYSIENDNLKIKDSFGSENVYKKK